MLWAWCGCRRHGRTPSVVLSAMTRTRWECTFSAPVTSRILPTSADGLADQLCKQAVIGSREVHPASRRSAVGHRLRMDLDSAHQVVRPDILGFRRLTARWLVFARPTPRRQDAHSAVLHWGAYASGLLGHPSRICVPIRRQSVPRSVAGPPPTRALGRACPRLAHTPIPARTAARRPPRTGSCVPNRRPAARRRAQSAVGGRQNSLFRLPARRLRPDSCRFWREIFWVSPAGHSADALVRGAQFVGRSGCSISGDHLREYECRAPNRYFRPVLEHGAYFAPVPYARPHLTTSRRPAR